MDIPRYTQIHHMPRAAFPDATAVLLSALSSLDHLWIDDTGGGLWRPYGGVWVPVSGRVLLEKQVGARASFDFQSIPQVFGSLELVMSVRSDRASNDGDSVFIALNNDTTNANYDSEIVLFYGPTGTAMTVLEYPAVTNSRSIGVATAATATTDHFAEVFATIVNPTGSQRKLIRGDCRWWGTRATTKNQIYMHNVGWANTAAVTRITLTPALGSNFIAGSVCSLYGNV